MECAEHGAQPKQYECFLQFGSKDFVESHKAGEEGTQPSIVPFGGEAGCVGKAVTQCFEKVGRRCKFLGRMLYHPFPLRTIPL